MKFFKIYFSPTGGTKKVADLVGRAWTCDMEKSYSMEEISLSDAEIDFSQYAFQAEDICMVAVPSFGGRVPEVALSQIRKMTGGKAKTIMLVVYGNRAYEDTLLELKDTLKSVGFQCIAGITGIAEHSIMHEFGKDRPDIQDEKELTEFGVKIKTSIEQNRIKEEVEVPGNLPYKEYHGVPLKPQAGKKCKKCGLCAKKCPVKAIPKEDPSMVDESKCISCMSCVSICPQHARDLNKVLLFAVSQKIKKACTTRKENELFFTY